MFQSRIRVLLLGLLIAVGGISAQTATDVAFFTDAKSLMRSRWAANGLFTIDTTGIAYEGKRCIKYVYDFKGAYWDGFGLRCAPVNITGATSLRFAFKMPAVAFLELQLLDAAGGGISRHTYLYGTGDWLVADIPLSEFTDLTDSLGGPNPLNYAKLYEIRYDIHTGALDANDTLLLDAIYLVGITPSNVIGEVRPFNENHSVKATSLTEGNARMNACALNGAMIRQGAARSGSLVTVKARSEKYRFKKQ